MPPSAKAHLDTATGVHPSSGAATAYLRMFPNSTTADECTAVAARSVWSFANRLADAFEIDRSKFETPEMFEEGLFGNQLGIFTIRYRKKDSDPINQLNYTRSFSLKATSPTTAVLVAYSHLEAGLR